MFIFCNTMPDEFDLKHVMTKDRIHTINSKDLNDDAKIWNLFPYKRFPDLEKCVEELVFHVLTVRIDVQGNFVVLGRNTNGRLRERGSIL